MNIHDFAKRYLYPYKLKGNEILPELCPFCRGGEHRDKYTFALNLDKQTFNCLRGSCGVTGNYYQLAKHFGEVAEMKDYEIHKTEKKYKKPTTQIKPTTNKAEEYLKLRGISKDTLTAYKIGCDDKDNIVFPYYLENKLVFVKFRPSKKVEKGERKAWREEGTKPILFGMDLCNYEMPLIITEGEIDTLSCYESGLRNVVSIPSGTEDFTWLETCWEWLKGFRKIILFGDSDAPGKEMVRKMMVKLSDYQVYTVENSCKDANELLYRKGKEEVKKVVDNAKKVPVYGLIDLADVQSVDMGSIKKVRSCIGPLDKAIGGFCMGELSVWTGKRGQGKSTFLGQMLIETINQGEKVCAYSGELPADRFQYWINLQAAGPDNITRKISSSSKEYSWISEETTEKIKEWYRGKFYLYDNKISRQRTEESKVIEVFKHAAKRYDCKIFLVDNLMTAKSYTSSDKDYYRMQSNFVAELAEFAENYNVHVHLVAHPKKTSGELSNDDVSGASEITNLAHNVFSVCKNTDPQIEGDTILNILKNREDGAEAMIGLVGL
jgi:twinkle protein